MFKESQSIDFGRKAPEQGGAQYKSGPIFRLRDFENKVQTQDEKEIVAKEIDRIIKRASKETSLSKDVFEQMKHYDKTTNDRNFFLGNRPGGSIMQMLYGLKPSEINSLECRKYIEEKINNKTIYIFGGGDSFKDLLNSKIVSPKEVINFDPYISQETIGKNNQGIYRSYNESASDLVISSNIKDGKLNKPDQILCDISTPYYLDSGEDIRKLFVNILYALNDGGEARIYPIALQNEETENGNFESRKKAFMQVINGLAQDPNFDLKIMETTEDGYTLIIQKLNKTSVIEKR
jgi:hypothetical protein